MDEASRVRSLDADIGNVFQSTKDPVPRRDGGIRRELQAEHDPSLPPPERRGGVKHAIALEQQGPPIHEPNGPGARPGIAIDIGRRRRVRRDRDKHRKEAAPVIVDVEMPPDRVPRSIVDQEARAGGEIQGRGHDGLADGPRHSAAGDGPVPLERFGTQSREVPCGKGGAPLPGAHGDPSGLAGRPLQTLAETSWEMERDGLEPAETRGPATRANLVRVHFALPEHRDRDARNAQDGTE